MNKRLSISYCLLITCFVLLSFCAILIDQLIKNQIEIVPIILETRLNNQTFYLSMQKISLVFYLEKDLKKSIPLYMLIQKNGSFFILTSDGYFMKPDFHHHGLIFGSKEKGENFILQEHQYGNFHIMILDNHDELITTNFTLNDTMIDIVSTKSSNFSNSTTIDFVIVPRFSKIYS